MWARRLVTVSAPCTRLICWGMKRIPLPHASHWPASPAQRLQTTLYMTSARPPLSRGGPHSSVTEVPFTLEIRFTGAEGGPGKDSEVQAGPGLLKQQGLVEQGTNEGCTLGSMCLSVQMMLRGAQSCPEGEMLQTEDSKDTDRS